MPANDDWYREWYDNAQHNLAPSVVCIMPIVVSPEPGVESHTGVVIGGVDETEQPHRPMWIMLREEIVAALYTCLVTENVIMPAEFSRIADVDSMMPQFEVRQQTGEVVEVPTSLHTIEEQYAPSMIGCATVTIRARNPEDVPEGGHERMRLITFAGEYNGERLVITFTAQGVEQMWQSLVRGWWFCRLEEPFASIIRQIDPDFFGDDDHHVV